MFERLICVNVGAPQPILAKGGTTGIFKRPVKSPVDVTRLGLSGDFIGDLDHHGGVDQAVYAYAQLDYGWWSEKLKVALAPGTFGENLLLSGPSSQDVCVGDRFEIGDVLLEVTSYRSPCVTLAARMGNTRFVKTFNAAARHGAYCRVLHEGKIAAGMAVRHFVFHGPKVTLMEFAAQECARDRDPDFERRLRATPVHWKAMRYLDRDLGKG